MKMHNSGLMAAYRFVITEAGWHLLCGEYLQYILLCLELAKKQAIEDDEMKLQIEQGRRV